MSYNDIIKNKKFIYTLQSIDRLEQDRQFCKHGLSHLFDVARTAYIISLENNINIAKDIIYAAALLHDIGRAEEYEKGTSHSEAGAKIAACILNDCGYTDEEIKLITQAILSHREDSGKNSLGSIIYAADKLTRPCFACDAARDCKWSSDKKNLTMRY